MSRPLRVSGSERSYSTARARGAIAGTRGPAEASLRDGGIAPPECPPTRIPSGWGGVELDRAERRLTVEGRALDLTDAEFALFVHFVERANRLVTRSELITSVWGTPSHRGSNLVDVVVCRLRQKLGLHRGMIETVYRLGYRFRAEDESAGAVSRGHAAAGV